MKYGVACAGSTKTWVEMLIESRPARRLSGALRYVSVPLNPSPEVPPVAPLAVPPHAGVPTTVPVRPCPDESTADVPDVSSSLYHSSSPLVISSALAVVTAVVASPPPTSNRAAESRTRGRGSLRGMALLGACERSHARDR